MIALLLSGCGSTSAPDQSTEEWIQLFNGRDLDGWDVKISGYDLNDNFGDTFRVENGVIKTSYEAYESFEARYGHLFYRRPFSHYVIAVEYRFVGDQTPGGADWARRNSGVMLHSQPPESMLKDQDFPISIEVQLLGGLGEGRRSTANLCTPGTNVVMGDSLETAHCISSSSNTYDGDQWVRVEVTVLGDSLIVHRIDGETVLAYSQPQMGDGNVSGHDPSILEDGRLLDSGYIALQSESHPVEFRKVELLDLVGCMDPASPNFKSYFVKADPSRCDG